MYPRSTWRLLNTHYLDGATNMAIDEAISRAVVAGLVPPTLRFFGWQPACLSLGQAQPGSDVDREACRINGIDVVRRPTGGHAILHTDELTYSVIALDADPRVAGTIVESYQRLSEGLLNGLKLMGVPTHQADRVDGHDRDQGPVCFEVPSNYEIVFGDKKLVGSAQMRKAGVVLQHGTIPLHGDIARITHYLSSQPDPDRVRSRATTVEAAIGCVIDFEDAARWMAEGLAQTLEIDLLPGELIDQERDWTDELRQNKYATHEWTFRM
ncbi:MAG TPA: biotin/lipoate A/B protein ligase family protein [Anaerolineae bacterium]|nr:biotin/lipoate A/B protein ligase family protein [Anaerolineae bacterium]